MDALEYLREVQATYIEFYRQTVRAKRAEAHECAVEVWVKPNVGPDEDGPPHALCVDILVRDSEKPAMHMVSSGEAREGRSVGSLTVGDVEARIFPAYWDLCPVWACVRDPDWSALDPWKKRWMDVNQGADGDEDGLCGVVHYLGRPVAEGGGYLYQIDFGSAPLEALTELLDLLAKMGATEIEVGLSDGSDLPADVRDALRQRELTLQQLMTLAIRLLRDLKEVEDVKQTSAEELMVRQRGQKEERHANLGNLHRLLQRTGVEARAKEVYRFIRGQRETMGPESPSDLSELRPVIKDDRFIANVQKLMKGEKQMLTRRLVADLWVACVWDAPNGMRFAMSDEPEAQGLSSEQAFDRALRNYLRHRGEVEISKNGSIQVAQTRDCYDATLLLDDNWWNEISKQVSGELLACVPARHLVLIGDTARKHAVSEIRKIARRVESAGDHLITDTILVRRKGTWHKYEDAPGPEPTAAAGIEKQPKPKNRPWWRFW